MLPDESLFHYTRTDISQQGWRMSLRSRNVWVMMIEFLLTVSLVRQFAPASA